MLQVGSDNNECLMSGLVSVSFNFDEEWLDILFQMVLVLGQVNHGFFGLVFQKVLIFKVMLDLNS